MQKNVVLIVVDQMRFDALGINGNPMIDTPNLDDLASNGINFTNMYSATPTCIPARASLLTGLKASRHGRVGYEEGVPWNYQQTMPKSFTDLGYQTECVGKMHVYPPRNRLGFQHVTLHDGYLHESRLLSEASNLSSSATDDYLSWLKEKLGSDVDLIDSGLDCNSWVARTWPYEEKYHPTNWTVSQAIETIKRRDPMNPLFLKVSFVRPHSPLDPPNYYLRMYEDKMNDLEEPVIGKWASEIGIDEKFSINFKKGRLNSKNQKRMIAAYYGLITHIDHQIGRLRMALWEHGLADNTLIAFVSDHGDQLGEHYLYRKGYPYQGSVHVPFIIYDPSLQDTMNQVDVLCELRDIYPTLIDLATGYTVKGIDGVSLKPSLFKDNKVSHQKEYYLHGEHTLGKDSSQFIITKEWKYIWYSMKNKEQLFQLEQDPNEEIDVSELAVYSAVLERLRGYLIDELTGREEGFVQGGQLEPVKTVKNVLNHIRK